MADKNNGDKSVDNIQEQIRKLLEEKEEIERRNREKQQLEQRLIKENVSTRAGSSFVAAGGGGERRSFGNNRDYVDLPFDLNTSSTESHQRRRSAQQSIYNSSIEGAPSLLDDSVESLRSADDTEDDDVMLPEHKQALRANRDILVENMTPDDIFNDLISKHILTNADVSRIKDRNTTEAINEELLNVLTRRSEKAFHVFVASLRRTLQGWLANRIDPVSPQKSKRKRRTGEVNVNLNCERVVPVSRKKQTCTCQDVEEQVLIMAKAAFAHIRRRDGTSTSFEQFKKELKQTNEVLKESMEIVNALKILCRHGEITDMTQGSVCFTIHCSSLASCLELWEVYESGVLLQVFQESLVTTALLNVCRAKQISLCLNISRLEYLTCALELAYKEQVTLQSRQAKPMPVKRHLKKKVTSIQKENAPEKISKVFRHNRGHAFQEIPVNTMQTSYPTHDQSLVNRCDKFTSIVEVHCSSTFPKSLDVPTENASTKPFLWQRTFATEQPTGSDIWLRSCGKEPPSWHTHVLGDQVTTPTCSSDHLNVASQDRQLSQENCMKAQQDACPYNLRYRLMNS